MRGRYEQASIRLVYPFNDGPDNDGPDSFKPFDRPQVLYHGRVTADLFEPLAMAIPIRSTLIEECVDGVLESLFLVGDEAGDVE